MKHLVLKGDTSRIEYIFIQNSSLTTGAGLTGLVFNSASLTAYYVRTQGSATAITLATQTVTGAFSSGGFVEVDATNMPGVYRFDVPDACFASGVDKAVLILKGATNMAPVTLEYQLVNFDPEAALATPTNITAGIITTATNVTTVNGLAAGVITAASIAADAITAAKIADGAIDAATFAAGAINAAAIAADAITDAKVAADVTIASVTGAVGSVTGAVGSVGAGGIAASSFAAGAIDAAAIATDALGALELAAGAASEIATAVRTELATELARVDVAVSTRSTAAAILTTALTEAYRANGAEGTLSQLMYELLAALTEFSISGTTITAKKLDRATTASTYTLDSAAAPTSRTRAT